MALIKAGVIRTHYKNLQEGITELSDEDLVLDINNIYPNTRRILEEYGLDREPYNRIFDYFYLVFLANENVDVRGLKKFIKSYRLKAEDVLCLCQEVSSKIIKLSQKKDTDLLDVDPRDLPSLLLMNVFKLFLYYVFDLCFDNSKIFVGNLRFKYGDLDNILTVIRQVDKQFDDVYTGAMIYKGLAKPLPKGAKYKPLKDDDLAVFQRIRFKYDYILVQKLFKELMPEEFGYYNSRFNMMDFIISNILAELEESEFNMELSPSFYSLLRKRAYLIPKNGINLKPSRFNLDLDLYERQLNGDNYLIVIQNIEHVSHVTLINLTKEFTVSTNALMYDVCNFLYSFYKLNDYAESMFGESYANDPRILVSFKTDNMFSQPFMVIKGKSEDYSYYDIESPYYWRYKDKGRNKLPSQNSKSFLKSLEKEEGSFIYVSAYKRKLPIGQRASEKAKEMAKFYCVELEDNETLVSPFIRNS